MTLTGMVRLAFVALLLAAAAVAGWTSGPAFGDYLTTARATTGRDLRIGQRLFVYRLQNAKPVEFAFSRPITLFRVLSSASIAPGASVRSNGWTYGYRVELLDTSGERILTQDIYSRAPMAGSVKYEDGPEIRFFRGSDTRITLDDEARILSPRPAARVRIAPLPSDRAVAAIDVRVYERRPYLGATEIAAFMRRSRSERAALARANAFPARLLTRSEMESIVINQWRPLGPTGVEGQDYRMLVMYQAEEDDDIREPGE